MPLPDPDLIAAENYAPSTSSSDTDNDSRYKFISFEGLTSCVRVRKELRINPQSMAVLGFDMPIHPHLEEPIPFVELLFHIQRGPRAKRLASLRLAPDRITIERNVKWNFRKISADFDVAVGINYEGEPLYHVEVNNLKPMPLVLGIAAVLFATGATLSSTENVGRFLLNIHPLRVYSSSSWETTASVAKNRREGLLRVHALNPFVTL